MNSPRSTVVAATVAIAALVVVSAAAADPAGESRPPVHDTVEITVTQPNFAAPYPNCPALGYAFTAATSFHVVRRSTLFYDDSGLETPEHVLREVRHVHFEGLVHKSTDPSLVVDYAGTWTIHFDYAEKVVVSTGLFRVTHPVGEEVLALSAGRQVRSLTAQRDLVPPTGHPPLEWEQAVCAYLAEL